MPNTPSQSTDQKIIDKERITSYTLVVSKPTPVHHGTYVSYANGKCRRSQPDGKACPECRKAWADKVKADRAKARALAKPHSLHDAAS